MKDLMLIPFNKPYIHGRELIYIAEAVSSGKISGDGLFTKKCHEFFESNYGFLKVLMTTSCTDALEMAAILLNICPGDEVIVPSFTFVSTANAFALRGAKLVFVDSLESNPNICSEQIAAHITKKTKAIVVVHYAGVACDMDKIITLANQFGIPVIEDAAQAIDSFYKGRALGGIGELGTFSFHETKNVISGEGGMLTINNSRYIQRSEVIREKGTNRSAFFRGEVDKYGWIDIGSSFLPSDIISAYLYAQLEQIRSIQERRLVLWNRYKSSFLSSVEQFGVNLPFIPDFATNNGHMFYLICRDLRQRTMLIDGLKAKGVHAVFHYLSLHSSPFFVAQHNGSQLPNSDRFSNCLVRLPLFFEMTDIQCDFVCESVLSVLQG
jgi:dTDP-4-amino-4,6-dideoxygalactose transaminase